MSAALLGAAAAPGEPGAPWLRARDVAQLGLGQVAVGAVAALMLSTLNRVMVVEFGLPATVPSALVALHFAVQLSRVRLGFASDRGVLARSGRARWVVGGGVVLGVGAALAGAGTALLATSRGWALAVCGLAYAAIGLGLSATGTPLLAAAAERARPTQLGAVAAALWIMMIAGIIVSSVVVGELIDPFSPGRLALVGAGVGVAAIALTGVAAVGRALRDPVTPSPDAPPTTEPTGFRSAWRATASDPATRRFAGFVFLGMLAFGAQDLILEPFAGTVFGLTPGETSKLSGAQHGSVLVGMLVAAALSLRVGSLRGWAAGGCLASAAAFVLLAQSPAIGSASVLRAAVALLGVANGVFTVGGIGAMMAITAAGGGGGGRNTGLRMGLFGAVQAMAYGTGSLAGGLATDVARAVLGTPAAGYAAVFVAEAVLFTGAAYLALRSAPRARLTAARLGERGGDLAAVLP